jgi:cardiolipin synthase
VGTDLTGVPFAGSKQVVGLTFSKTTSIDGVWSTIGSTNLDWRSFLHNDEVNAAILGRDARQMDVMFARDLAESDAIDLERREQRLLLLRLKEGAAARPCLTCDAS